MKYAILIILFPILFAYCGETTITPNYKGKWYYAQEKTSFFTDSSSIGEESLVRLDTPRISYFDFWAFNDNNLFAYSDLKNGIISNVGTYMIYNSDTIIINFGSIEKPQIDTFKTQFFDNQDTAVFEVHKIIFFIDSVFLLDTIINNDMSFSITKELVKLDSTRRKAIKEIKLLKVK